MKWLFFALVAQVLFADPMTLEQAESLFVKNNLDLLAQHFDVEASKALIRQQKIWDNPNLTWEESINPLIGPSDTPGANHQFQLSQLLVIAKRSKRVQIAQYDANIAQLNFEETLRSLKFELRRSFMTLYFANRNQAFYQNSLEDLRTCVANLERLAASRSVLLADLMRVRALLLSLETEYLELEQLITRETANLEILIGEPFSELSKPALNQKFVDVSLDHIISLALEHRPDLQISDMLVKQERVNLALSRLTWVPDFELGVNFQQKGNYVDNYLGLTLSFDLPIFDRGQALAKSSLSSLRAKQKRQESIRNKLLAEIDEVYERASQIDQLVSKWDQTYLERYEKLSQSMIQNYNQKNISLLVFTDFYESYRDSVVSMNQTMLNRQLAFAELNYVAGVDIDALKI